ncbi:hypothetical protein COBT_000522 [Conglomerata obtusa]
MKNKNNQTDLQNKNINVTAKKNTSKHDLINICEPQNLGDPSKIDRFAIKVDNCNNQQCTIANNLGPDLLKESCYNDIPETIEYIENVIKCDTAEDIHERHSVKSNTAESEPVLNYGLSCLCLDQKDSITVNNDSHEKRSNLRNLEMERKQSGMNDENKLENEYTIINMRNITNNEFGNDNKDSVNVDTSKFMHACLVSSKNVIITNTQEFNTSYHQVAPLNEINISVDRKNNHKIDVDNKNILIDDFNHKDNQNLIYKNDHQNRPCLIDEFDGKICQDNCLEVDHDNSHHNDDVFCRKNSNINFYNQNTNINYKSPINNCHTKMINLIEQDNKGKTNLRISIADEEQIFSNIEVTHENKVKEELKIQNEKNEKVYKRCKYEYTREKRSSIELSILNTNEIKNKTTHKIMILDNKQEDKEGNSNEIIISKAENMKEDKNNTFRSKNNTGFELLLNNNKVEIECNKKNDALHKEFNYKDSQKANTNLQDLVHENIKNNSHEINAINIYNVEECDRNISNIINDLKTSPSILKNRTGILKETNNNQSKINTTNTYNLINEKLNTCDKNNSLSYIMQNNDHIHDKLSNIQNNNAEINEKQKDEKIKDLDTDVKHNKLLNNTQITKKEFLATCSNKNFYNKDFNTENINNQTDSDSKYYKKSIVNEYLTKDITDLQFLHLKNREDFENQQYSMNIDQIILNNILLKVENEVYFSTKNVQERSKIKVFQYKCCETNFTGYFEFSDHIEKYHPNEFNMEYTEKGSNRNEKKFMRDEEGSKLGLGKFETDLFNKCYLNSDGFVDNFNEDTKDYTQFYEPENEYMDKTVNENGVIHQQKSNLGTINYDKFMRGNTNYSRSKLCLSYENKINLLHQNNSKPEKNFENKKFKYDEVVKDSLLINGNKNFGNSSTDDLYRDSKTRLMNENFNSDRIKFRDAKSINFYNNRIYYDSQREKERKVADLLLEMRSDTSGHNIQHRTVSDKLPSNINNRFVFERNQFIHSEYDRRLIHELTKKNMYMKNLKDIAEQKKYRVAQQIYHNNLNFNKNKENQVDQAYTTQINNFYNVDNRKNNIIVEPKTKELNQKELKFNEEKVFIAEKKEIKHFIKRKFQCEKKECRRLFTSKAGLLYHIEHGHTKEKDVVKPFLCTFKDCEKKYKNANGLKYHVEHGHNKSNYL